MVSVQVDRGLPNLQHRGYSIAVWSGAAAFFETDAKHDFGWDS